MKDHDDDPERALDALFDDTARAPSEMEQRRLVAHAERIAERRGRELRLRTRIVWPAALAAAAAAVYLVVAPVRPARDPSGMGAAVAPRIEAPAPVAVVAPLHSSGASEPSHPLELEPEDPVTHVLTGDPSDVDPLDLGPLMQDQPETEG